MQTVYIGNTLVNDIMLGSQRMDDVLQKNVVTESIIRNDPYSSSLVLAVPGYKFPNPVGFSQANYYSDISANIRGTGTSYNLIPTGSGGGLIYASGSSYFTSDGYNGGLALFGGQNFGATTGSDANLDFQTGAFTFETYLMYPQTSSLARTFLYGGYSGTNGYFLTTQATVAIRYVSRDSVIFDVDVNPVPNTWNHLALVMNASNDLALFWNGTRVYQNLNLSNPLPPKTTIEFGGKDGSDAGTVVYQDYKIYKGAAKYSPDSSSISLPQSMIQLVYK